MKLLSIGCLLTLWLVCADAGASLPHHDGRLDHTAFIYRPEARFDPLIQRLLAEDVLRTMPRGDGDVFYVVPEGGTKLLEEMQLRYLEELLHRYGEGAGPSADLR